MKDKRFKAIVEIIYTMEDFNDTTENEKINLENWVAESMLEVGVNTLVDVKSLEEIEIKND